MGAWIEIYTKINMFMRRKVAPFMGAWIEIGSSRAKKEAQKVAPFMGAWIEMDYTNLPLTLTYRRSLHGSVD